MIDRFFDLIFIDSFALAINLTFGTLLGTKICNYSWEGVVNSELSTPESSASYSESPPSLEADFSRDVEKKEWFAIYYRSNSHFEINRVLTPILKIKYSTKELFFGRRDRGKISWLDKLSINTQFI